MDDLIARLTAAIDKHELAATEEDTDPVFGGYAGGSWHTRACGLWQGETEKCSCDVPAQIHRQCAADRKMLAAVQRGIDGHPGQHAFTIPGREEWACPECVEWNKTVLDPSVLTFMAERYDLEVTSG